MQRCLLGLVRRTIKQKVLEVFALILNEDKDVRVTGGAGIVKETVFAFTDIFQVAIVRIRVARDVRVRNVLIKLLFEIAIFLDFELPFPE